MRTFPIQGEHYSVERRIVSPPTLATHGHLTRSRPCLSAPALAQYWERARRRRGEGRPSQPNVPHSPVVTVQRLGSSYLPRVGDRSASAGRRRCPSPWDTSVVRW